MLHTVTDLQVREAAEGEVASRTITGYAILFNVPSAPLYSYDDEEAREVIAPGAVTKELLDGCDIKMTMFHNRQLILARSKNGAGTLSYGVDDKGVYFEFEAPKTADGDKALELVRRGDIAGCSFMFTTHYYDSAYVARDVKREDGKTIVTYTVNVITGIYDFTLAADPAYPDTTCEAEARELVKELRTVEPKNEDKMREQVREMRRAASQLL
jgi:HK97 family phage prohead protease